MDFSCDRQTNVSLPDINPAPGAGEWLRVSCSSSVGSGKGFTLYSAWSNEASRGGVNKEPGDDEEENCNAAGNHERWVSNLGDPSLAG